MYPSETNCISVPNVLFYYCITENIGVLKKTVSFISLTLVVALTQVEWIFFYRDCYDNRFVQERLLETVPIKHKDFTSVLPRCLSLYILSFLNPMELCKAAQVSWHWRSLAEQVN